MTKSCSVVWDEVVGMVVVWGKMVYDYILPKFSLLGLFESFYVLWCLVVWRQQKNVWPQ